MFYHGLLMGPSKLAVLADHLNSLVPGYLEVQVEADRLSTEFSTVLYQDEELKALLERCVPKNEVEARFKKLHLRKFRRQPKELLDEYNKLAVEFSENVKEDQKTNKLELEYKPEYVEGLTPQVVEAIRKAASLSCFWNFRTVSRSPAIRSSRFSPHMLS